MFLFGREGTMIDRLCLLCRAPVSSLLKITLITVLRRVCTPLQKTFITVLNVFVFMQDRPLPLPNGGGLFFLCQFHCYRLP